MSFDLSDYDFELPEELIAQRPVEPRDSSRLLVLDRARGAWEHRRFVDLPSFLSAGDLVVANNTRVLRARLLGRRLLPAGPVGAGGAGATAALGGKVEFLLLEEKSPRVWEGLFHASARYVPGLRFVVPTPDGQGLQGVLVRGSSESSSGTVVAEFDRDPVSSGAGELPLPHYIKRGQTWGGAVGGVPEGSGAAGLGRGDSGSSAALTGERAGPTGADESAYQTVYSRSPGSAAAPTAGLHFTPRVLDDLRAHGVSWAEVTLHVGLGTFRPVKAADIREHQMHEERFEISASTAEAVARTHAAGGRVLAVGTTTVRTLESSLGRAGAGRTSLFIHPDGHRFEVVDRMLTNFHLPRSTLLMMVSAFAGRELVLAAYREAVLQRYRFFSYGDAMLIL